MREAAGTAVAAGWATFPDDGVTLGVLLDAAREQISRQPTRGVVRLSARPTGMRPSSAPDGATAKGA
jgi:hypothetical protein